MIVNAIDFILSFIMFSILAISILFIIFIIYGIFLISIIILMIYTAVDGFKDRCSREWKKLFP